MTLYFLDSRGNKRPVKTGVTPETALKEISAYVEQINPKFKIYYTRLWYSEDYKGTMYDIGSHTEFFLLAE